MKTTEPTPPLALSGEGYQITVTTEAEALKNELLVEAKGITAIAVPEDVDAVNLQVAKLARVRLDVEKTRTAVKAPVLAIGKKIDDTAKGYIDALKTEEDRLTKLLADFAAVERKKAQDAENERQQLLKKQEQQRQEAERQAAEAERLKEEAAAKKFEAVTPAEKRAATILDKKADQLAEVAQETHHVAKQTGQSALFQALNLVSTKAPANVAFDLDYDVNDVHALAAFSKDLVTIEVKRAELLKLIAVVGKNGEIPGITIKEVPRVTKKRL